jgi:hypothetical protein
MSSIVEDEQEVVASEDPLEQEDNDYQIQRQPLYAQIYIRPDLEFTTRMCGRYQINPGIEHC